MNSTKLAPWGMAAVFAIIGPVIDHGLERAVRGPTVQVAPDPNPWPVAPPGSRNPSSYPPFVFAGWPDWAWPTVDAIVWRESRGNPAARHVNRNGTIDRGLLQINEVNVPTLVAAGIIAGAGDLFDGLTNMRAGLYLFRLEGWAPWAT